MGTVMKSTLDYHCSDHLLSTPLVKKGFPPQIAQDDPTHHTWPWAEETPHDLGEEDTQAMQLLSGTANQQELWEADCAMTSWWGDLLFIWTILWIGREVKPIRLRPGKGVTDGANKGISWVGSLSSWMGHIRQGELMVGLCSSVRLKVAKAAHGITGLTIQVEIHYWEKSKYKRDKSKLWARINKTSSLTWLAFQMCKSISAFSVALKTRK